MADSFRPKTAMYVKDGCLLYSDNARHAKAIKDAEDVIKDIKGDQHLENKQQATQRHDCESVKKKDKTGNKLGHSHVRSGDKSKAPKLNTNLRDQNTFHDRKAHSSKRNDISQTDNVEVNAANFDADCVLSNADTSAQSEYREIGVDVLNADVVGVQAEANASATLNHTDVQVNALNVEATGAAFGARAVANHEHTTLGVEAGNVKATGLDARIGVALETKTGTSVEAGNVKVTGVGPIGAVADVDLSGGVSAGNVNVGMSGVTGVKVETKPSFGDDNLTVGPPGIAIGPGIGFGCPTMGGFHGRDRGPEDGAGSTENRGQQTDIRGTANGKGTDTPIGISSVASQGTSRGTRRETKQGTSDGISQGTSLGSHYTYSHQGRQTGSTHGINAGPTYRDGHGTSGLNRNKMPRHTFQCTNTSRSDSRASSVDPSFNRDKEGCDQRMMSSRNTTPFTTNDTFPDIDQNGHQNVVRVRQVSARLPSASNDKATSNTMKMHRLDIPQSSTNANDQASHGDRFDALVAEMVSQECRSDHFQESNEAKTANSKKITCREELKNELKNKYKASRNGSNLDRNGTQRDDRSSENEAMEQQTEKKKPFGEHKNIHGFDTLASSSNRPLKKIGRNVVGFDS